ncbi:MAG TPA: SRPBCC domain-containing protein [Longimicrobiales bacterium]|nr:SRPBCC domain-containing protein [Longimicrobiales bacterium]
MHLEKAQVALPSDREVSVSRAFNAGRALVYEAYTTPELVRRWLLGPTGWTMPVCEMDVRVGGKFRWVWRSDEDGSEFGFHGEFREVDAPAKLRHTEAYDPGSVGGGMGEAGEAMVTVTFTETGGITTLTTLIDYGSKEARDAAMSTGMTDGMEMSYQKLDGLLADRG